MAVFEFEAIGPGGQKKRSTIEAANQAEAIKQLRSRGLKPTKIRESKKAAAGGGGRRGPDHPEPGSAPGRGGAAPGCELGPAAASPLNRGGTGIQSPPP